MEREKIPNNCSVGEDIWFLNIAFLNGKETFSVSKMYTYHFTSKKLCLRNIYTA